MNNKFIIHSMTRNYHKKHIEEGQASRLGKDEYENCFKFSGKISHSFISRCLNNISSGIITNKSEYQ